VKIKMPLFLFLLFIFLQFTSSCTGLTHIWIDEGYRPLPVKKVFVTGIMLDISMKKLVEDEFSTLLSDHRTGSVESYKLISYYSTPDRDTIISTIKSQDADVFLIARLIAFKKGEVLLPGRPSVLPAWYRDWYSYYTDGLNFVQSPGYIVENDLIIMETNVYDTATENLIWSAQSETALLTCGCEEIKVLIRDTVKRMAHDKLIP
jgi:hypothetical protein